MVRYRQELFFGCYADPDALPEIHQLPTQIAAELHVLGRLATRAHADDARETRSRAADGSAE
jgi:hypothetical protein